MRGFMKGSSNDNKVLFLLNHRTNTLAKTHTHSIDVREDPVDGIGIGWPSIGVETLVGGGREGEAGRRGMCDVWEPRVDEYERINPREWNTSGYVRGSILDKSSTGSEIRIPRGVARSIEREGVRNARVHKMALDTRRNQAKKHGRWLQGKEESAMSDQSNEYPSMMVDESLYTQYDPSDSVASYYTPSSNLVKRKKNKKKKSENKYKQSMSTYGTLASEHLR